MNPVAAQQVSLDNALVAPEKRLKIEKCNARIEFNKPQREATYQITLDNTIKKIKDTDAYRFKLDKKKFRIDTDVFREILQICPRLPNQDFVEPPSEEEIVPFIKEFGYNGKYDMLSEIHTDHMHQPWKKFVAVINRCIYGKSIKEEPAQKPKRANKPEPAEQAETAKKTARAKSKGMDLLSNVALLEVAQLKKVLKKSKQDTHMLHASDSDDGVGSQPKVPDELQDKTTCINEGTGTIPGVPDVPKDLYESENKSWGVSNDDDNDDDNDDGNDDDSNNDDNDDDSNDDGNNVEDNDDHEQADDERTESDDEEE
ncbi:hypothetical protein Tco_0877236 [Tanacetum coccineum]|uniref:Uncharacterized protein n=1 Tax=Tanacetum coccineum TaxID=301880 RepID=A0ABQ5BUK2_9ASTR